MKLINFIQTKMANIGMYLLLLKLLSWCQIIQTVSTDGHVNIQIEVLQYDNPLGTSYHGSDFTSQRKCCDNSTVTPCSGTDLCDSYFVFCIGGINSRGACNGPGATTAVISNKNSFSTSYDNTIIHSFKWDHWKSGAIEYIVDPMDKDGGSKELIDSFTSTAALRADMSYENSTQQILSFQNFVSIDIGMRIWCQDGYRGSDCSSKCSIKPYRVCNQENGTILLPSCNDPYVSSLTLQEYSLPVNFAPYNLHNLLVNFFQQEICSGAYEIDIQILHFTLTGSVEFKTKCNNTTLSGLLFSAHIYILSLTNKAALVRYFPHIPLAISTVTKNLPRGANILLMIRKISYHDADSSSSCYGHGCNVHISVCLNRHNGRCQVTSSTMQYVLTTTNWTKCDTSSPSEVHYLTGVTSWPFFYVDVKYGRNIKWQGQQQPPQTYFADKTYKEAKAVQIKFTSKDKSKTFILEVSIWCDTRHAGDHCQHSCHATGNRICDKGGKSICKTGYHGPTCTDVNECQDQNSCRNGGSCHNTQGSFVCTCQPGWTGPACDVDVDECVLGICTKATRCINHTPPSNVLCRCAHGFSGKYCTDNNECNNRFVKVCQHNATCLNKFGSYYCLCPDGFTGRRCEQDIDECQLSVCSSHSTSSCTNTVGGYSCVCSAGWTGLTCDQDIDECTSIPCRNGNCSNTLGSYKCNCYPGNTGQHCEIDINECASTTCGNGGTCVNLHYPKTYRCDCLSGWDPKGQCFNHTDECKELHPCVHGSCRNKDGHYICTCANGWSGKNCSIDIDECQNNPCMHQGTCRNRDGGYSCKCPAGWKGTNCSVDINECDTIHPCANSGKCNNTPGGFTCQCAKGWSGPNCTVDINECTALRPCQHNSRCKNTRGGYICHCPVQWQGQNCSVDVNECTKHNPCKHNGDCINTKGGYTCQCTKGWTGKDCNNDINECSQPMCLHNGTCNNIDGSYTCTCPIHWTGLRCETDINECQNSPCKHSSTCHNFEGGYSCTCLQGWTGTNCETDVNECLHSPCKHTGACINVKGGYSCTCPQNWTGTNCETDVNECQSSPCKHNGSCKNVEGGYSCVCPQNWNGTNCETDVNECDNSPCKHLGTCHNINGGYKCTCSRHWTGTNCEIDVNECNYYPCKHNATCNNYGGGYNCSCPLQWTGINCENDVNECNNSPCKHNASCYNFEGGYNCTCPQGWTGHRCETDVNECKHSPCKNNETCHNKFGSYSCNCTQGWQGKYCEKDIDECRDNSNPCLHGYVCINTNGSFVCKQDGKLPTSSFAEHAPTTVSSATSTKSANSQVTSVSSYTGLYTTTTKIGPTSESKSDIYISTSPTELSSTTSISRSRTTPNTATVSATSIQTSNTKFAAATSTLTSSLGPHVSTVAVYVRLEDAIHPGCTSSGWNVTINMTILTQLYPGIKVNQIYFGDNSCRGKLMGNQLVFLQGFRDCLTAERISGDNILYENELFYAIFDPIHPFIIRQYKWKYGVECDISRNEATSSRVHHNVESHHSAISSHYRINMTFFKDPGFMNQLPGNPIQTNVGENVYVKVFTAATDWSIKMRLHTCYTKPKEAAENMTYFIIKDGCEVDSNTHIVSQSTHETRFVFQDFVYSTNREGLNIYCNATFCETKDYSPGCAQSCVSHETQALVGK